MLFHVFDVMHQEVDYDFASILNARLGVGGRYRSYPQPMPTKSMYFTMVYVRVATVTVHESNRMVSEVNHCNAEMCVACVRRSICVFLH